MVYALLFLLLRTYCMRSLIVAVRYSKGVPGCAELVLAVKDSMCSIAALLDIPDPNGRNDPPTLFLRTPLLEH